jgi:transposase
MEIDPATSRRVPKMQIEPDQMVCPVCGGGLEIVPVLHHMICAYIGPQYDFAAAADGYTCPKCRRAIVSGDTACEIVGASARCRRCGKEMIVSPPPAMQAG